MSVLVFQAFISSILSKLSSNKGSGWSLLVKLNDGSAVIDADLGDQVCLLRSLKTAMNMNMNMNNAMNEP